MEQKIHEGGLSAVLSRRIKLKFALLSAIPLVALAFLLARGVYSTDSSDQPLRQTSTAENPEYHITRLTGFRFIRPLFAAKPAAEFPGYLKIKSSVEDLIKLYQDKGVLASAAVYLRDFDKSNWIAVNPREQFTPGSIIKIPVLMTILKYDEDHPGFVDGRMEYSHRFVLPEKMQQSIVGKQIEIGKTYSRRQLLQSMIEYSDNNATQLLWTVMDKESYANMFAAFGLAKPDVSANELHLTAAECSVFLESLFNASYLSIPHSEFAVDLLTRSAFDQGFMKGIPGENLLIAHKFGESGSDVHHQLHETGIVYIDGKPYLITVMTKGSDRADLTQLATVIQGISRTIYYGLTAK